MALGRNPALQGQAHPADLGTAELPQPTSQSLLISPLVYTHHSLALFS